MTNLLSGLVVFIIHIVIIFITPKLPAIANANTAPWWYSALLGLITVLYIYFGYQTYKKENRRLAGGIFYILALITAFLIIMSNASY
jgi:hypothetical protein